MIGEYVEARLAGRVPDRGVELFVLGGLRAWLNEGGNLTRDHWRTCGRQGSNLTEATLWRRLIGASRSATATQDGGKIGEVYSSKDAS